MILLIYLIGYVASYLLLKWYFTKDTDWSVGSRTVVLLMSLLSWLAVVGFVFIAVIKKLSQLIDNENEAKW